MADEPNIVAADTDDLDAFQKLLAGKAQEKTEDAETNTPTPETEEEDNKPEETSAETTDEPKPDDNQEEGESKPAEEAPKKKNTFQERINELTARAREAERREADALRRIQEAEDQQKTTPAQPTVSTKDDSPQPDTKNEDGSDKYPLGEFDPAYIRDLTRHTIQKEQAEANQRNETERAQRQEQEARAQLQEKWSEKLTTATEKHEDFLDKTIQLESAFDGLDPKYSDYLVQTIKSLDYGPDVLYHLANNLAEAQSFVKLGPLGATLALGELNARFKPTNATPPPKPKVSDAPPPPPEVNKGNKTRTTVAADTDDLDAFIKMFNNKKSGRRS